MPSDGRINRIMTTLSRHTFSTLLVLRLTPVFPLSVVNVAAGLAKVELTPFVAASLIGSAPSNFIYAALGAGLADALNRGAVLDPRMLADAASGRPVVRVRPPRGRHHPGQCAAAALIARLSGLG